MIAFIRYVSFHLHYAYIMTSMWLKVILESKNFCLVRLGTSCGTIRCTIQFQHRTTFGIVGVIIMSYLRWSSWVVTVLILISKVIRLSSCLHHSLTIRCKVHHLQTFTLLIPSIGFSILLLHFVRLLFSNEKRGVNTNSIEPIVAKLPCKKPRSLYLH